MARELLASLIVLTLTACPNDPDPYSDDTTTTATGSTSSSSASASTVSTTGDELGDTSGLVESSGAVADSSTGGVDDGCGSSKPCELGFCVAPYADNDRGDFVCVPACVEAGDEASWCFDAGACCDAAATCTERGYCESPSDTEGSSSTG